MIKFENVEVVGWKHAIRGMRNLMNSWEKSDSFCNFDNCSDCSDRDKCERIYEFNGRPYRSTLHDFHHIGPNDLDLMKHLRNAGTDHRKFMSMITVYVDITAPLYWWKEFDTHKVGSVMNYSSITHRIAVKEFTLKDFSCEHLIGMDDPLSVEDTDEFKQDFYDLFWVSSDVLKITTQSLNFYRQRYLETKNKKYIWQLIQQLPSSYNQRRTIRLSYEALINIYESRRDCKSEELDEWKCFCDFVKSLPYAEIITGTENVEVEPHDK